MSTATRMHRLRPNSRFGPVWWPCRPCQQDDRDARESSTDVALDIDEGADMVLTSFAREVAELLG